MKRKRNRIVLRELAWALGQKIILAEVPQIMARIVSDNVVAEETVV